jgi:hypothetical protein
MPAILQGFAAGLPGNGIPSASNGEVQRDASAQRSRAVSPTLASVHRRRVESPSFWTLRRSTTCFTAASALFRSDSEIIRSQEIGTI